MNGLVPVSMSTPPQDIVHSSVRKCMTPEEHDERPMATVSVYTGSWQRLPRHAIGSFHAHFCDARRSHFWTSKQQSVRHSCSLRISRDLTIQRAHAFFSGTDFCSASTNIIQNSFSPLFPEGSLSAFGWGLRVGVSSSTHDIIYGLYSVTSGHQLLMK